MRDLQRRLWPSPDTPQQAAARDAEATMTRLRSYYENLAYDDENERAEWLTHLESFTAVVGSDTDNPWETGPTTQLIRRIAEPVITAAEARSMRFAKRPLVGTARHGMRTARTHTAPDGTPVILIDVNLIGFLHVTAGLVSDALPVTARQPGRLTFNADPDAIERRLRSEPLLALRATFAALKLAAGDPPSDLMLPRSLVNEPLADILRDAVEYFIVAHEIAHAALDHPERARPQEGASEEMEADARGLEVSLAALAENGVPPSFGVVGPELFFSSLLFVEQVSAAARGDTRSLLELAHLDAGAAPDYPSYGHRRAALRAVVNRSMPPDMLAATRRATAAMDTAFTGLLWAAVTLVDAVAGRQPRAPGHAEYPRTAQ